MNANLLDANLIFALGPPGSHSHSALIYLSTLNQFYFPENIVFCDSNTDVLRNARNEGMPCLIAAENSRGGLVNEVARFWLDQPTDRPMQIVGEIQMPISQHLMVHPDTTIGDIDEIHSHPKPHTGNMTHHIACFSMATHNTLQKLSSMRGYEKGAAEWYSTAPICR